MAELTPNFIHEFKEKHAHPHKPPFVFGLRTGYVRAWLFVVFKVWLIVALLNGVNSMNVVEKDLTLLDSYVRNDFSHPEIFFDNDDTKTILSYKKTKEVKIPLIVTDNLMPRGPMAINQSSGVVASAVTNSP